MNFENLPVKSNVVEKSDPVLSEDGQEQVTAHKEESSIDGQEQSSAPEGRFEDEFIDDISELEDSLEGNALELTDSEKASDVSDFIDSYVGNATNIDDLMGLFVATEEKGRELGQVVVTRSYYGAGSNNTEIFGIGNKFDGGEFIKAVKDSNEHLINYHGNSLPESFKSKVLEFISGEKPVLSEDVAEPAPEEQSNVVEKSDPVLSEDGQEQVTAHKEESSIDGQEQSSAPEGESSIPVETSQEKGSELNSPIESFAEKLQVYNEIESHLKEGLGSVRSVAELIVLIKDVDSFAETTGLDIPGITDEGQLYQTKTMASNVERYLQELMNGSDESLFLSGKRVPGVLKQKIKEIQAR